MSNIVQFKRPVPTRWVDQGTYEVWGKAITILEAGAAVDNAVYGVAFALFQAGELTEEELNNFARSWMDKEAILQRKKAEHRAMVVWGGVA